METIFNFAENSPRHRRTKHRETAGNRTTTTTTTTKRACNGKVSATLTGRYRDPFAANAEVYERLLLACSIVHIFRCFPLSTLSEQINGKLDDSSFNLFPYTHTHTYKRRRVQKSLAAARKREGTRKRTGGANGNALSR